MKKSLTILSTILICLAVLTSCTSGETKANEKIAAIEKKGENEGTPLFNFVQSYLNQNPDFFNNSIIQEKKTLDMDKRFQEQIKAGILKDMVFDFLLINQDYKNNTNHTATFTTTVREKDSLFSFTVFVDAPLNDSIVAKLKEFESYKLEGKFSLGAEEFGSNIKIKEELRVVNNKTTITHDMDVHDVKIDLKDVTQIE